MDKEPGMFNRDALFGKKDEPQRNEPRATVNVTPGLAANPGTRSQAPADQGRSDLRLPEPPKAQPQPQQARAEEPTGSRLIVGPDIKLRGVEITDCDTLVVEGRVEASMDSRVIQIAENGVFSGTVSIDVAEIRGRFEGELTARKQLVIYSTGKVCGQIRYGKIRIEEGGELVGDVSTLSRGAAPAIREIALTGAAPGSPASQSSNQSSSPAQAAAASSPTSNAAPTGSPPRATQSATEPQQTSASAVREPAPSRPPRHR
jgi:cytoskeletal protein CcmA (bactofilin family)